MSVRVWNGEKLTRLGLCGAGVVLAFAGAAKLISALGTARILRESDPIFGLPNQLVLVAAGLVELWVVWMLVHSKSTPLKLLLVGALGTNFLLYRVGLWWLGVAKPCPCLGNASAWTHLDPGTLDILAKGALVWLMVSGYAPLLRLWFRREFEPLTETSRARALASAEEIDGASR